MLGSTSSEAAITLDASVSVDQGSASTSVTAVGMSTGGTNRLLLALVSADDASSGNIVTNVTGAGLTWQLVVRSNGQRGDAEIWRAFAASQLTGQSITASLAQRAASSMTVIALAGVDTSGTNGSGAIGAIKAASAGSGAPTATITTTRANSWLFASGNDWNKATARTVGAGQTMIHQYLASVGDTYWAQRTTAPTPASGTSVTINDTAPTTDSYNLSVCEVLAAPSGSDGIPPVVSLTAPTNGTTVSGNSVTISANASDNVGVTGVQFTVDGTNIGSADTTAPYSITWNSTTVSNASHILGATASDAAGNKTTATVTVTVNNTDTTPPTVTMTAPGNGTTVSGNSVTVSANASDNVGVVGVQFKVDGANLGSEDTVAPYSVVWNTLTLANGSHTVAATARDASNNMRTASVTVTVRNADSTAPTVSMTAPADGSTVSGKSVTVSATATDNVGVVGVQFLLDGAATGAEVKSTPYAVVWDTTATPNGPHSLAARARDAAGNSTTSAAIGVTVNNPLAVSVAAVSGTTGQSVPFSAVASGGAPPYSYSWTFGDGGAGSGATPSHAYSQSGTFTVTVTVTDSAFAVAKGTTTATITDSGSNPARPQPVSLNTSSSQYSHLVAAFPLWITDPSANTVDVVNGISGAPSSIAVQTDPVMGNVFSSGGQSHFTVPYDSRLDFASPNDTARPFSVSVWVKVTASSNSLTTDDNPPNMYVFAFDANTIQSAWPGYSFGAAATLAQNGPITTELDIDGHAAQQTMFGKKVINDGQWHLLVATYVPAASTSQPTSTGKIYIDGVLDSTSNAMAELESPLVAKNPLNPFALYIGADDDGVSNPWLGMFCDLRFYSATLSDADVAAMYNPATRWELYH